MANIQNELNNIKNAVFGKDVRDSIHDAIKTCYDDASVNNDNANMEVKLARGVHNTLNDRLSESDKKQKELSSQLEHKANTIDVNSKVWSMANMGQDVKEAMTGGSVAVVGENTILSENIVNNQIDFYKTKFLKCGKNLFNKENAIIGKYVSNGNGEINTNNNYFASDFISVLGGVNYTTNLHDQVAFYDSSYNFISGVDGEDGIGNVRTYTTPSNASYIRICGTLSVLDKYQIEFGSVSTEYEDYQLILKNDCNEKKYEKLANEIQNNSEYYENNYVKTIVGKNKFNKEDCIKGFYVRNTTGELVENSNYSVSSFIDVEAGLNYYCSPIFDQCAFYDSKKNYISGVDGYQVAGGKCINAPSNAKYVRLSVLNTIKNVYQFEEGEESTYFENYKKCIPNNLIDMNYINENISNYSIARIMSSIFKGGKNIKFIGDSITAGVGGTGYSMTGETIYSNFKVNESGYCWANLLKSYLEEKFDCVVKNFGTSGRNSRDLLQNINSIVREEDDIIICMIGTNDRNNESRNNIVNSKEILNQTIKEIYNVVTSMGKDIIFMSNIPSSVVNENDNKLFHMEDVDHCIMCACGELGIEYISVYKLFMEYCQTRNKTIDEFLADGLHPNDNGYDVMFYLISNALGFGVKRDSATW